jgi:hypothetical protein
MLLLTDGAVMCQDTDTPNWWKLIPDNYGDYVNGTWAGLAKGESAVSGILCQREAEPVCCGAGEGPSRSKPGSTFAFANRIVLVRV